jgi:hypothetical protein
MASIGAGIAAGMFLTWLQKTFTQASELQTAFGLPVLGALSEVKSSEVVATRKRDMRRLAGAGAALAALTAFYIYWEVLRLPAVQVDGAATASMPTETGAAALRIR